MKRTNEFKTNPVAPGVLPAFPHLGADLPLRNVRLVILSVAEGLFLMLLLSA